jgi:hypothetical protein
VDKGVRQVWDMGNTGGVGGDYYLPGSDHAAGFYLFPRFEKEENEY